ncbi:SH2 domain-containing protein 2A isoform X2 [Hyperolius riggenbachi]|uniref:SH2 domain-containing protein 2A isoform X2 n=1 Tax=Hyperolius riggenbachi TaxID=752182 RepID=UPI0035A3AB5C
MGAARRMEAGTGGLLLQEKPALPKLTLKQDIAMKPGVKLKEQTYQWFERTQRKKLIKMGQFPEWFHGFVTRSRAEEILQDKPQGSFLIRFCESRVGFVLSYRGAERCRHFVLNQQDDEQYVIEGEDTAHPQLEDLISYYCKNPVQPYKELLSTPCSKNPRKPDSPDVLRSSPKSPSRGFMYGKVIKQGKEMPNPATVLAKSPKEKNKAFFNGKVQDELEVALLARKSTPPPEKDPPQSQEDHKDHLAAYAPVTKPPGKIRGVSHKEPVSRGPTYASIDELHAYTEPNTWATTEESKFEQDHIAFYAVGRGSCVIDLENVYSEVDVNAAASCECRAPRYVPSGFSTLQHPTNKISQPEKTSAFHSSFRTQKQLTSLQENNAMGQGKASKQVSKPKSKAKKKTPVQFDDEAYGKSSSHQTSPPLLPPPQAEQENIYEKIPEDYPMKARKPRRLAETEYP